MTAPIAPLTGPAAWLGRDMANATVWIRPFSPEAIAEIDSALRGLQRRGLTWPKFGREDFPLPAFSGEIGSALDELESGRGFVLYRGFPVGRYSDAELKDIYWGLGAHLGSHPYQNALGELIG